MNEAVFVLLVTVYMFGAGVMWIMVHSEEKSFPYKTASIFFWPVRLVAHLWIGLKEVIQEIRSR